MKINRRLNQIKPDCVLADPKRGVLLRTYLLNVSIIGTVDELLQLCQAIGLSQSKDQLCFHIRLAGLLTSHLQELDEVLPVSCTHQSFFFT